MEVNCQTCNYTVAMNGLDGAYSQILVNGRSVFSPITGLTVWNRCHQKWLSGLK